MVSEQELGYSEKQAHLMALVQEPVVARPKIGFGKHWDMTVRFEVQLRHRKNFELGQGQIQASEPGLEFDLRLEIEELASVV